MDAASHFLTWLYQHLATPRNAGSFVPLLEIMFVVNLGVFVWEKFLSNIYEDILGEIEKSSYEKKGIGFEDQTPAMDSMDEEFQKRIEEKKRESLGVLSKIGRWGQRFGAGAAVLVIVLLWLIAFLTEGGKAPAVSTFCVYLLSLIIFCPPVGTPLLARWKLYRHMSALERDIAAHEDKKEVALEYETRRQSM